MDKQEVIRQFIIPAEICELELPQKILELLTVDTLFVEAAMA